MATRHSYSRLSLEPRRQGSIIMKYNFVILTIATAGFLLGCSDSQNPAAQKKAQDTTTQALAAPKQAEQEATLTAKQAAIHELPKIVEETLPQNEEALTPENLEQNVKSIADTLTENGTQAPREQLEQDIKQVLETIMKEAPAAGGDTYK